MVKKYLFAIVLFVFTFSISAQEVEVNPPYHIKTVSFVQSNQNIIPIVQLGDSFQLQFDDLHATEDVYYYRITHCDYDWKQSQLSVNEYLIGFNDQQITSYNNSTNTLQIYSHYTVSLPNKNTQLKVSGNYIISILNENREVVFSRKLIVYEELVTVPMQIKRARVINDRDIKHNIDFSIKSTVINFQSPLTNVKVLLMQNGKFNNAIKNIKPQYTIGNDLIYKYDAETQFWAGNEYLFFENKVIQAANNSISRITSDSGLYNCFLYTNTARKNAPYTYFPDINGNFLLKNVNATNNDIEADYAWIYFSLDAPSYAANKDIYVTGMFNNYVLSEENKMDFNEKKGIFEKAIMIKQGFTNYNYTATNKQRKIDEEDAVDGNFHQTENNYFAIIYYRENNQRYDRIIGKGIASSTNIIN